MSAYVTVKAPQGCTQFIVRSESELDAIKRWAQTMGFLFRVTWR